MIKSVDGRTGRTLYILYSGDYFATHENCALGTVTGSCVVICLHDSMRRIGGMSHLIIPGSLGTEGIFHDIIAHQGITQMEHIIGEMVKLGSDRKGLQAKIFGGAYNTENDKRYRGLSYDIIHFIHEYFDSEGIPVVSDDLGGQYRRKIIFFPDSGKAFRKLLLNNEVHSEFIRMEQEYIDRVFLKREEFGKIIMFE